MIDIPPSLPRRNFGARYATIFKLFGVVFLVLLLLIPLAMIGGILRERLDRRNEAVTDITGSWGRRQNIIGPVLGIPYQYRFKTVREIAGADGKMERREVEENAVATAWFLPQDLSVVCDAQTQTLSRGIYDAAVYRATLLLAGKFGIPDFSSLNIDLRDVLWKDAFVSIAINDLRGVREGLILKWDAADLPLLPGSQLPGYTTGTTAQLPDGTIDREIPFSTALAINGSEGIYFAPFGVRNEVTLKSNWPDPGFRGAFLPAERKVQADGFEAKWQVSYYGRDYPQQWDGRTGNQRFTTATVEASFFGADFLSLLDSYRFVERSIKYGVLFFVLAFATFFLFEITGRQKIHPFQYLMVGAALCLFYLALLSLSEFVGFGWAYLVASAIATALVTLYCGQFLSGGSRTLLVGGGLAGVYTFLYVTLQQQDYALLMGSAALFILLTIVMVVTRKINWYAQDNA